MTVLAWIVATAATVPTAALSALLVAGRRRGPAERRPGGEAPPFALLVPAHDEAAGIAATVRAASTGLRACDRILVVADNCTDATATAAAAAGATVVERRDAARIGKGYALAAGRDQLALDPPAVVIVLDADCTATPGTLARLAAAAAAHGRPVQGRYLLVPAADASAIVRISCFAFRLKNLVRQRALHRAGAPALLQGSGMAFPWPLFATAPLASGSLVEDLELGLAMTAAGHPPRFEEGAEIDSPAAATAATRGQRRRWEQGSAAVATRWLPRILVMAWRRPRLLALAADLAVPPVAMLAAGATIAIALTVALDGPGATALMPAVALAAAGGAVAMSWWREGRDTLPAAILPRVPFYMLWKLPVILAALFGRERRWQRTERPA